MYHNIEYTCFELKSYKFIIFIASIVESQGSLEVIIYYITDKGAIYPLWGKFWRDLLGFNGHI